MKIMLKRLSISLVWWCPVLLISFAGCSQGPITGGTTGVLRTDGNPIPDVQVTIYSTADPDARGYAVTSGDGTFELVMQDSTGPLYLETGSYIAVLESVGAPTELPTDSGLTGRRMKRWC